MFNSIISFKSIKKNNFICLMILLFIGNYYSAYSQNERFHGGGGDGATTIISEINFNNVSYVGNNLTVQIDRAVGQDDTTEDEIINFLIIFSEPVIAFNTTDVLLSGSALPSTAQITGSGTNYNIAVSGMWSNGTVIIDVPTGNVQNSVGNPNQAPIYIDNEVFFTGADLNVEITRASGQSYVTNSDVIHFSASFNSEVSDFTNEDVQYSGIANPTSLSVSGTGKLYDIAVSGMQNDGSITINIPPNVVHDSSGKSNNNSVNTENTVIYDKSRPSVDIKLADGQTDPSYELPLRFDIIFSEEVTNFTNESVSYGGSAGLTLTVSGIGSNYNVIIDGALTNETVTINIPEGVAYDYIGNSNTSSENTHNSIQFLGVTGFNDVLNSEKVKIYYSNGNMVISFNEVPHEIVWLEVYNIQGQYILQKELNNSLNFVPLKSSNIYLIKLTGYKYMYFSKILAQ